MILDLFEGLSVTYWLDGGWGVDALYGRQTREHRDIDINFDATKTEDVLTALHRKIPCISLEGQKVFHSGYEPREKDLHDIQILDLIAL